MNILNILFLLINILSLDVVLAYIYPMCNRDDAGGCISRNHITEVEVEEGALSTILYIINYVTCSSFMFFKNIFREYFISEDDNLSWKYGRIYSYKPPPSLFETLAIWTGAIYKNSKEDERKWESYKLFMLASSILLSRHLDQKISHGPLSDLRNWITRSSIKLNQRRNILDAMVPPHYTCPTIISSRHLGFIIDHFVQFVRTINISLEKNRHSKIK